MAKTRVEYVFNPNKRQSGFMVAITMLSYNRTEYVSLLKQFQQTDPRTELYLTQENRYNYKTQIDSCYC